MLLIFIQVIYTLYLLYNNKVFLFKKISQNPKIFTKVYIRKSKLKFVQNRIAQTLKIVYTEYVVEMF